VLEDLPGEHDVGAVAPERDPVGLLHHDVDIPPGPDVDADDVALVLVQQLSVRHRAPAPG
jgi:hypothetical protein